MNSSTNISIRETNIGGLSFPLGSTLKVEYLNGSKEGNGIVYSPKKVKLARLHFHKDIIEGFCVFFSEKGPKIKECVFENGIQSGWMREYKDSKAVFTGIYKNGKIISELRNYNGRSDFVEEIQNNKRIAIRQYKGEEYLEGICYSYNNGELRSVYQFKCGENDKILYKFMNERMIEYDENGKMIYQGEYEGSVENGFKRKGKGEVYCYKANELFMIEYMNNGNKTGYKVIEGNIMKQYEKNQLIYHGGWCMKDREGRNNCRRLISTKEIDNNEGDLCMKEKEIVRHGEGFVYSSSSVYYKAIFNEGKEVNRLFLISGEDMLLYDEEKRVVYKGGYDDNYMKKGKGYRYEYERGILKRVFVCENGKDVYKWIELNGNRMSEFDENGLRVYEGEYEGSIENGYRRKGRGEVFLYKNGNLYEIDQMIDNKKTSYKLIEGKVMKQYEGDNLVYTGGWYMNDGEIGYNGEGFVYSSSSVYYKAIFDEGREIRKVMKIKNDEMILYDEEKRVVYKGGYDDSYMKKGKGYRYEYERRILKRVFVCENGKDVYKWLELNGNRMSEFDENGLRVYEGGMNEESYLCFLRNGEGELYDKKDELIYSGEWKDGKREGKGSYFKNGDVIYVGEWKDDKPNGNGQYINSKGDVVWEGEWKNGYGDMGNGIGLYYEDGKKCGLYENGNVKYEGEWKDGKPNGRGVLFDENGNKKYEGEWKNGLIEIEKRVWFDYENEECKVTDDKGNTIYKGKWENDQPEGYGILYGIEEYKGNWKNGILRIGTYAYIHYSDKLVYLTYQNGNEKYKGEWKNGKPNGQGTWFDENGNKKYEGEWKNGMIEIVKRVWFDYENEECKVTDDKGNTIYKGKWENDQPEGYGILYGVEEYKGNWKNGILRIGTYAYIHYSDKLVYLKYQNGSVKYKGEWKNGKPNGQGTWFDEKGNKKYEGEWKNGMIEIEKGVVVRYDTGKSGLINSNGEIIYEGRIENCKANGYGKIVRRNGEVIEGEWKDGRLDMTEVEWIEIEDCNVYQNEIIPSGLFGCMKKVMRNEIDIMELPIDMSSFYPLYIKNGNDLLTLVTNNELKQSVSELVIEEGCGNELKIDLKICGFENLERLIVKKNSLQNLNSLVISNNPQLSSIVTEDGAWGTGAFLNVKSVFLSSIF